MGLEWVVTHLLLEGSASAWTSPRHERLTFLVADGVCALKPTRNFGSIRSETALAKGKATFCILPLVATSSQSSDVGCCHAGLGATRRLLVDGRAGMIFYDASALDCCRRSCCCRVVAPSSVLVPAKLGYLSGCCA